MPTSDTRGGSGNRPGPPGGAPRGVRSYREVGLGLGLAAVFAVLFYLWGEDLLPRGFGRYGQFFPLVGAVALTLAVALFLTEWFGFAGREVRKVHLAARDFLFLFALAFLLFLAAKAVTGVLAAGMSAEYGIPSRVFVYLIPIPAFAMTVRILLNSEVAILFTVAASVLAAGAGQGKWEALLYLLVAGTAGAARTGRIPDRHRLVLAGALMAPVSAAAAVALEVAFHGAAAAGWAAVFGAAAGLVSGPGCLAMLPIAESAFGYASDIRLVELSSIGHPLLRRMMTEAPGTFHHSVVVGTLAEAGASSIRANPVLCRVAALFHDVGKVEKPEYFSENQAGAENVHDRLTPGMSRVVILSHVKEGMRLAREHRLGDRVVEIISQHHGTSLLYFFLDKAGPMIRERKASEETFRYPGPKPRTREAAIVMLADAAEAAVRSLRAPRAAEVDEMVDRIVHRTYLDGQLDECDMTLRDLHEVGAAFKRVLYALAQPRVEYPVPSARKGP